MRRKILAAALSGAALAAPAWAQDEVPDLDVDTAMECGVRISFFGGLVEEENPEAANEFMLAGATWMTMGLTRLGGDEAAFDAILASKTDALVAEVEAEASEEAARDMLLYGAAGCEIIKVGYQEEFDAIYQELASQQP